MLSQTHCPHNQPVQMTYNQIFSSLSPYPLPTKLTLTQLTYVEKSLATFTCVSAGQAVAAAVAAVQGRSQLRASAWIALAGMLRWARLKAPSLLGVAGGPKCWV